MQYGNIAIELLGLLDPDNVNASLMHVSDEVLNALVEQDLSDGHTPACVKASLQFIAWRVKLPRACLTCDATGEVDDSDPSVGLYGTAPCAHCVDQSNCPRCGHGITFVGDLDDGDCSAFCLTCGWKTGAQSTIPHYECFCLEARDDAALMYEQTCAELDDLLLVQHLERNDDFAYDAYRERQLHSGRFDSRF